jgi:hypothetical protein
MRTLMRRFDAFMLRALGIFEFSDDPECVLRLQITQSPRTLHLDGYMVNAGEPVLELHLWNEHIPPLPPSGPDLAWATLVRRLLIRSFRAVGEQFSCDPRLADVRAVGGVMSWLSIKGHPAGELLLRRLGFTVMPSHNPLGRFGEFWENLYAWLIMWTFNAASLRGRQLLNMRRAEMWMPVEDFLSRYGMSETLPEQAVLPVSATWNAIAYSHASHFER